MGFFVGSWEVVLKNAGLHGYISSAFFLQYVHMLTKYVGKRAAHMPTKKLLNIRNDHNSGGRRHGRCVR